MPLRPLKSNHQDKHHYGPFHMLDPPKDYSMFSAPSPKLAWKAPPLTSGWSPRPTHSPLSLPEAVWAPQKKARMRADSGLSAPSSSSRLGNTSATTLFICNLIESLHPLFESSTVDPQVDPRSVDSSVVQKMLIYINQWTKNLNNIKFLNTHPVEKDSILGSYGVVSEAFSNIGIHSKAPPASPSPKVADSLSPPQTHPPSPRPHPTALVAALVTLAAGTTAGSSAWKKKKAVECSGTSRDTIYACANPPFPPPPVLHDTHTSGGKNHVHDSPESFACEPVIQRPGSCHRPFNTSNSSSCQPIVVMIESKAALVALLPLAPQISHLVDSLSSSIIVKLFRLLYGGLCLSTTSIPTPSDLSRVKTFMHTLIPKGSSVRCEVPSLQSFCKLIGVPFLHRGNPINLKDASLILASSVYKDSIRLATPPRIVHDSRWADTCTIYFDIWDLQTGCRMKSFIDCSLNVGSVVCFFCKASMKIRAPLCTHCYSWGHNTNYCNSSCMVCPICNGPHCEDNHCALAACCKGHLKRNPPVPPTANEESCPHLALCKNCGKSHAASSGNTISTVFC